MQTRANKSRDSRGVAVADRSAASKHAGKTAVVLADNSPESLQLEKLQLMADNSPQAAESARLQAIGDGGADPTAQYLPQRALSGVPSQIKSNADGAHGSQKSVSSVQRRQAILGPMSIGSSLQPIQRRDAEQKWSGVDDKKVKSYIDNAINESGGDVRAAFRNLQALRQSPKEVNEICFDESLAAAEHYLFARSQVAGTLVPRFWMASKVLGYAVKKFVTGKGRQYSICPTTPASSGQLIWGMKGAEDGQIDYWKDRPDPQKEKTDGNKEQEEKKTEEAYSQTRYIRKQFD